MKIGIIGGGSVGQTLGSKLAQNGHDIVLGIRNPTDAEIGKDRGYAGTLRDWLKGKSAKVASMADAARHGEIIFNTTLGEHAIAALKLAGADNLKGKLLVDVSNPLDFSHGMPPSILPQYTGRTSLGEEIQKAFPDVKIVKAFNTMSAAVMINPAGVPGEHDLLIAGNDADAKATFKSLATKEFGWKSIIDLGGIESARGMELILPLWVNLWGVNGTPMFNFKIAK
jgi:8-hydroxy-5-deazaflavin:NADPH oxidoreductase